MVRSKTILSLACVPLALGLGACGLDDSQTDSQVVLDRGGDTDEEGLHLHDVGDAPTPTKRGSTPPKRGSTSPDSKTLISTDAEISPINPNRPGPKKGEPGKFGFCGDGQLQTFIGEECDDGNTINGDGCSKQCKIEKTSGPTKSGGLLQPIKPLPIKPIIPGGGAGPGGGAPGPPGIAAAACPGPAANMVCGLFCAVADLRSTFAASMRSAGVPCRSPLVSFLKAYITLTARLQRNCPFIASIAASDASNES